MIGVKNSYCLVDYTVSRKVLVYVTNIDLDYEEYHIIGYRPCKTNTIDYTNIKYSIWHGFLIFLQKSLPIIYQTPNLLIYIIAEKNQKFEKIQFTNFWFWHFGHTIFQFKITDRLVIFELVVLYAGGSMKSVRSNRCWKNWRLTFHIFFSAMKFY